MPDGGPIDESSPMASTISPVGSALAAFAAASATGPQAARVATALQGLADPQPSFAVEISSAGRLAAGLADLRGAAQALENARQDGSPGRQFEATTSLIASFNRVIEAGATLQGTGRDELEALVFGGGTRVSQVLLSRPGESTSPRPADFGLAVGADGSLRVDLQRLSDAYRQDAPAVLEALGNLAGRIESFTRARLESAASVAPLAALAINDLLGSTAASRSALEAQATALQPAFQAIRGTGQALAAYLGVASL